MSDFDEMDFDDLDEELADAFEGEAQPDEMAPEDVFKMVMINRHRKTKVSVTLRDEEGDEVGLPEVIAQILNYIKDRLNDKEENQFTSQILPLMSQSVVSGLGRMLGINHTAFFLTNPTSRTAIINMMAVGMLLLKFVQENKLTINTTEEDVSDEEIEEIERKAHASSMATVAHMAGQNPRDVLQHMVDQGQLTDEDLIDIMGKKKEEDDDDDKGSEKD